MQSFELATWDNKINFNQKSVKFIFKVDYMVDPANRDGLYGFKDWQINIAKEIIDIEDLSGWNCPTFNKEIRYNIYKIDDPGLYFAVDAAISKNSRPTALDSLVYNATKNDDLLKNNWQSELYTANQNEIEKITINFDGRNFVKTRYIYPDTNNDLVPDSNEKYCIIKKGVYSAGKNFDLIPNPDVKKIDYFPLSVTINFKTDNMVNLANKNTIYGKTNWQKGVVQEIIDIKDVSPLVMPYHTSDTLYDIYKITDPNLYFGSWQVTDEDKRVTNLDSLLYTAENP